MKKIVAFIFYFCKGKLRQAKIKKIGERSRYATKLRSYSGHKMQTADVINQKIIDMIEQKFPFMVARIGYGELFQMRTYDFKITLHKKKSTDQLCNCAGFFPNDIQLGYEFVNLMKDSIKEIDVLGANLDPLEEYYIRKFMNTELELGYIYELEPWRGKVHWSSALEGKKVLVVHPFKESIIKQYEKREEIFSESDILPKFNLIVYKAVQTIAGEKDLRFQNWFEALDFMEMEIANIDFDIAIIGCGAYGLPLAARIKGMNKGAIHLGGATQVLFGISGKRYEEQNDLAYIRKFFNQSWIHPLDEDKPKEFKKVEGGCYW